MEKVEKCCKEELKELWCIIALDPPPPSKGNSTGDLRQMLTSGLALSAPF